MSRDTILDDAIIKAKEAEDWQLVEWLRMARGSESAARWYSDKLREAHRVERKLLNENAKLRNQLHDQQDTAQHNFVRNAREYKRVCDENDRLRELVRDMWRFTSAACKKHPRLFDPSAQGGQMVQLNAIDAFEQRMRELGAEVDG